MTAWIVILALLAVSAGYDAPSALAQSPSAETAPNRPERHEAPDERGHNQGDDSGDRSTDAAASDIEREITGSGEVVDNINSDSEYATGRDLEGPPAQFPAAKTPQ